MIRSLYTSKSGMYAQQTKLDTISHNLGNAQTDGYKRVEVGFKDLLNESLDRKGYPLHDKKADIGTGVKPSNWYRDNSQGSLKETLRGTDIAIDGEGYFKVIGPDGSEAYTRDGAFSIDAMGRLVDGRGNRVEINFEKGKGYGNPAITASNLLVDTEGSVFIKDRDRFVKVGSIPTYTAVGDRAFQSIGENLFLPSDGVQVVRTKDCHIYQGALEASNVDIGQEFTDMIITQRAFQLSSKSLTTADEMWGMVNNMRR